MSMESKGLIYIDLCYDNLKLDIIMKPSTQIQGATKQVIFCKYMKTRLDSFATSHPNAG